ncbi:MAG: hypothetical protein K8S97_09730 [Anaerolineae bacterium]|nr:hypothetical protein [Anaerolineae bacterium]
MGVLFDLVLADKESAAAIGTSKQLFEDFRVFPTKMLDQVTLDSLFALCDPTATDIESWGQTPLFAAGEVSVFQLPPYFIKKLARLPKNERMNLAKRWGQTGKLRVYFRFSRLTPEEIATTIEHMVDNLCDFACEAVNQSKRVFLRCVP